MKKECHASDDEEEEEDADEEKQDRTKGTFFRYPISQWPHVRKQLGFPIIKTSFCLLEFGLEFNFFSSV